MKKYTITLAAFLIGIVVYGQSPDQALKLLADENYSAAKSEIDGAMKNDEHRGKAKTWYSRGEIYLAILGQNSSLAPDAPQVIKESFDKAKDLSQPGVIYYDNHNAKLEEAWGVTMNKGYDQYKSQQYQKAFDLYLESSKFKEDPLSSLYAAFTASKMKDYKNAEKYFQKTIDLGSKEEENYLDLIGVLAMKDNPNRDLNKAIDVAAKGLSDNPGSNKIKEVEIKLYLQANRKEDAISKLNAAVSSDPNNADHYYALGVLYGETNDIDAAVQNYKKAINIDPNNFSANFNLGVVYYNKGAEFSKMLDGMDFAIYQKEGKKVEAQAKEDFAKSLPYFEKAYRLDSSDPNLGQYLDVVYDFLKTDNSARVNK